MSITDHEPNMNQLIRDLLVIASWLATLVLYTAFLPALGAALAIVLVLRDFCDLLATFAAMAIPPTQSA